MTRFSANLGFLWKELPLPDAIAAAKSTGFDAVECHWPYEFAAGEVRAALDEAGLPMLGLNTRRGNAQAGEFGLAALAGREAEARAAIDEAIAFAAETGTRNVHVMAGNAAGAEADACFRANLRHACNRAAAHGIGILIEPMNRHDAPGYFLGSAAQAEALIHDLALPNLKLMFDCYHIGRSGADVTSLLMSLLPLIGHIQFASVPDRGTPDHGNLDYREVFSALAAAGHDAPLGAEYRPVAPTAQTLGWMSKYRS
ncbi:MAG: TIM barrel protein [Nitratireductor sp.]